MRQVAHHRSQSNSKGTHKTPALLRFCLSHHALRDLTLVLPGQSESRCHRGREQEDKKRRLAPLTSISFRERLGVGWPISADVGPNLFRLHSISYAIPTSIGRHHAGITRHLCQDGQSPYLMTLRGYNCPCSEGYGSSLTITNRYCCVGFYSWWFPSLLCC